MTSGGAAIPDASEDYESELDEPLLLKLQPKIARSDNLKMYSWYFGEIDRNTAVLAVERDNIDGCFVVRDPSDRRYKELGFYSLSIWDYEKGRAVHFRIARNAHGEYSIDGSRNLFDSVSELIEFYKKKPIDDKFLLTCSPSSLV